MSETKEPELLYGCIASIYARANAFSSRDDAYEEAMQEIVEECRKCSLLKKQPVPQWTADPPKEDGVYAWTKNGKIAVIVLFSAQDAREFCEEYPDMLWYKIALPPLPERKESDE